MPSPPRKPGGRGCGRVELGRHEVRRALRVEVEHLRRVGGQGEAVLVRPLRHDLAAAREDGDVERVDAHLLEHLDLAGRRRSAAAARTPRAAGVTSR